MFDFKVTVPENTVDEGRIKPADDADFEMFRTFSVKIMLILSLGFAEVLVDDGVTEFKRDAESQFEKEMLDVETVMDVGLPLEEEVGDQDDTDRLPR